MHTRYIIIMKTEQVRKAKRSGIKLSEQNPKVTCTTTDHEEEAYTFGKIDEKLKEVLRTKYLLLRRQGIMELRNHGKPNTIH